MNPWPFVVIAWAVALIFACRWMAACRTRRETDLELIEKWTGHRKP